MIEFVRGSLAAVARTVMRHPDHDLRITLYPVFHVGSAAFYDALSFGESFLTRRSSHPGGKLVFEIFDRGRPPLTARSPASA